MVYYLIEGIPTGVKGFVSGGVEAVWCVWRGGSWWWNGSNVSCNRDKKCEIRRLLMWRSVKAAPSTHLTCQEDYCFWQPYHFHCGLLLKKKTGSQRRGRSLSWVVFQRHEPHRSDDLLKHRFWVSSSSSSSLFVLVRPPSCSLSTECWHVVACACVYVFFFPSVRRYHVVLIRSDMPSGHLELQLIPTCLAGGPDFELQSIRPDGKWLPELRRVFHSPAGSCGSSGGSGEF